MRGKHHGGRVPRVLSARLQALAVWAAVTSCAMSVAAESCPYPLGDQLLTGDVMAYGGNAVTPADQLIDTVWIGTQLAPGTFAYAGGTLSFLFESETDFEIPGTTVTSEAHITAYREYSPRTGWNARPEFVSSPDVTKPVPSGDHTSPTMAARAGSTWAVWQVAGPSAGAPDWPSTGSYLLARERTAGGWQSTLSFSPTDPISRSSLPKAALVGADTLVIYQTNRFEPDSAESHIAAQTIVGGAVGTPVNLSVPADGWSDEAAALASDGTRAAAVWGARNTTDLFAVGGSQVWMALRSASGAWGTPILVSRDGQDAIYKPAVAWHAGRPYVAWAARDANASAFGDSSLFVRSVDPDTGALGAISAVTDGRYRGDEAAPAMLSFNGSLHLIWSSTSAIDGSGATWQVARTLTCAMDSSGACPLVTVDRPSDLLVADLWPGLLDVDGTLVATYALNFGNFVGTAANQHSVTRVLERPPLLGDTLRASYGADAPAADSEGELRLSVRLETAAGAPATSDHFALRLSDGSLMRMPPGFSSRDFTVPYRGGEAAHPVEALWCGQPIPLTQFALAPAPSAGLFGGLAGEIVFIAAIAAALVVVRVRQTRRSRGARTEPSGPDSTARRERDSKEGEEE